MTRKEAGCRYHSVFERDVHLMAIHPQHLQSRQVIWNPQNTWTKPSALLAAASLVLHALANGHYGF